MTSRAGLSSRRPTSRGWRSLPCTVHSMKATCTTISGRTQCARRRGRPVALRERRRGDLERVEPRAQVEQQLRVEARADLAGEHEVVALEVADEQRAQADARALRIGEAADDELLARLALHLQPVRRAAVLVGRVAPLGDDALPALGARALPRLAARRAAARAAAAARSGSALEQRAALVERQRGHVAAVEPEHVEHVVAGRARCSHTRSPRRRGSRRAPAAPRSRRRTRDTSRCAAAGCATAAGRSRPSLNASRRMPSSLRSKIHSGPVNRSCVSVAAIGSNHEGGAGDTRTAV